MPPEVFRPATAAPRQLPGLRLQAGLVALSVAVVAAPPAAGTMLIAPLVPTSMASTLRWALADGALIVAPGPYRGSVVVAAMRADLLPIALAHGALVVTARFGGCGSFKKDPR